MAKQKFWSSDKIVAFVAMGISIFTLIIFVKQTNIIEEQSHLSVMPYLMLETSNNNFEGSFKIDIINYGVGPAIIEQRKFFYEGESFEMEFGEFLESHIPLMDSVIVTNRSSLQPGLAIPAGIERNMVTIGGNRTSYVTFIQIMQELDSDAFYYEVTYKSIYGDRWKISSLSDAPEKLD